MILSCIIFYILGAIITYFAAKYYDWEGDILYPGCPAPPVEIFAAFWIIGLPIILIIKLGEKIARLGEQHRMEKEAKARLRVAETAKEQQLLTEAEQQADEFYQSLNNKLHG